MQALKSILVLFLLVAACRSDTDPVDAYAPTFVYADARRMLPFPSDRFLIEDSGPRDTSHEQATGYRINLSPYDVEDETLAKSPTVVESLAGLDGFGTSAEIAVGLTHVADFSGLTDPATAFERSVADDSPVVLVSLDPNDDEAGTPLPYVAHFEDDGKVLFLRAAKPLRASSWYGVVVRPGLRDGVGRDFVSPPGFSARYEAANAGDLEGEGYARLREVYPGAVVFALTFRTASITTRLRALVDEVRSLTPSAVTWSVRAPLPGHASVETIVEGWFTNRDYRDAEGKLTESVVREEKVPFTLTLPKVAGGVTEPFPVVLSQHGFGSNRQGMLVMADGFARRGLALLSIDAPNHGSRGPGDGVNGDFLYGVRDTFGIWTDGQSIAIKGWHFRDILRQQVLTHLQLVQAVEAWEGDVVRAGNVPGADLDMDALGYIGHSMGAVMGGVSGAVLSEFKRVVLNVGGGRISDIFARNESVDELAMVALKPRGVSMADGWRAVNMAQAAVDPGDPINYVAHIAKAPFAGEEPRPLLMQNVLGDFLVANHASFALARAADASFIGPHIVETPGLPHLTIPASGVSGDDLSLIAFYRDIEIGGNTVRADHGNLLGSKTGVDQAAEFFLTGRVVQP